jgi:Lrp/AsnC family transcriptional regulator, leucine-responsive regulatory protein
METKMADSTQKLDEFDRNILRALQKDGRGSNAQLAKAVNLSESACLRRLRNLEDRGVIDGYRADINPGAVGLPMSVFVTLSLTAQSQAALTAFEQAVAQIPEVMECYLMTGSSDYLLRMVARDVEDLERLHAQRLTRIPGVSRVTSSIAMRTVVKRGGLPL